VRVMLVAGVRKNKQTGDNKRQRGGAGVDMTISFPIDFDRV
jgi:hypothetical protein